MRTCGVIHSTHLTIYMEINVSHLYGGESLSHALCLMHV